MKQWYFPIIYLAIIAFLGYHYWSSVQAFKAFEHLDKQLNADYTVLDNSAELIYRGINKEYRAYPNAINSTFFSLCKKNVEDTYKTIDFIKKNKAELVIDTTAIFSYSPNNSFFKKDKIGEIKGELMQYQANLIQLISDPKEQKWMRDNLGVTKIINNESYWETLKYLPLNGVLNELSFLENKVKCDELLLLDYFNKKISSDVIICGPTFKTAIAPKKAFLIEGETFEADIYLAAYSSNPGSNVTIKVNGESLDINQGLAHFKGKKESTGLKIFKAVATVKNPLTGQTTTTVGSFEYQVLPKCSRDCQ